MKQNCLEIFLLSVFVFWLIKYTVSHCFTLYLKICMRAFHITSSRGQYCISSQPPRPVLTDSSFLSGCTSCSILSMAGSLSRSPACAGIQAGCRFLELGLPL